MKWPWVSRLAYEILRDERDRLREQNDGLMEHLKRVDRVEHGMTELPREPKRVLEPMPQELVEFINEHASPHIRREMRNQAFKRYHSKGESWAQIMRDVMPRKDDDEQQETPAAR
jgi:iron-sulfur cluster repair protein YtfE (RIC family)